MDWTKIQIRGSRNLPNYGIQEDYSWLLEPELDYRDSDDDEDEDTSSSLNEQDFLDLYTDGFGNCFSDADPGL